MQASSSIPPHSHLHTPPLTSIIPAKLSSTTPFPLSSDLNGSTNSSSENHSLLHTKNTQKGELPPIHLPGTYRHPFGPTPSISRPASTTPTDNISLTVVNGELVHNHTHHHNNTHSQPTVNGRETIVKMSAQEQQQAPSSISGPESLITQVRAPGEEMDGGGGTGHGPPEGATTNGVQTEDKLASLITQVKNPESTDDTCEYYSALSSRSIENWFGFMSMAALAQ